jgi:hypothetical protein
LIIEFTVVVQILSEYHFNVEPSEAQEL